MKWKLAIPALLLVLALLPAAPAAAFNWGLGVDLGYNLFMPDEKHNISYFGWPLGAALFESEIVLPGAGGLRVGFTGENPAHEVWLGTSLNRLSVEDFSTSEIGLTANYQYNFPMRGALKPYVTAGLGLTRAAYNSDENDQSATAMLFGGGAGLAHKMGTGRLRAELRYDQSGEGTYGEGDNKYNIIPKGGVFAVRLGFDLWAK